MTLFDRPLRGDWLFWWAMTLVAISAAIAVIASPNVGSYTLDGMKAFVGFLVFAGVYVALFALVPAWIRRAMRRRRLEVEAADEVS